MIKFVNYCNYCKIIAKLNWIQDATIIKANRWFRNYKNYFFGFLQFIKDKKKYNINININVSIIEKNIRFFFVYYSYIFHIYYLLYIIQIQFHLFIQFYNPIIIKLKNKDFIFFIFYILELYITFFKYYNDLFDLYINIFITKLLI